MHSVFSTADKRMFATSREILGGPPEKLLLSRLADGVFGEEWGFVDAASLRKAGAEELSMLSDVLDSKRVLLSLRAVLFDHHDSGLDLQLKAGLHRLGRAAADLDAASLQRIAEGLPDAWARCLQAAWFRLSRLEECRDSAAALRELLWKGDRK